MTLRIFLFLHEQAKKPTTIREICAQIREYPRIMTNLLPAREFLILVLKSCFLPIWKPLILVTSKRVRTLTLTPGSPGRATLPLFLWRRGGRHLGAGYGARPLPLLIQHRSATDAGQFPFHTHLLHTSSSVFSCFNSSSVFSCFCMSITSP